MKDTQLKEMIRFLETSEQKAYEKDTPSPCGHIKENIAYLQDEDPMHTLDILYPVQTKTQYPWIFYLHGGGFCMHSKDGIYRNYATRLASDDFAVVTINYRLAPAVDHHNIIQDMLSALSFIAKHTTHYHLDPNQMFLAGDSAGAYLSSICAAILTNENIKSQLAIPFAISCRAVGSLCGMFDFQQFLEDKEVRFPMKKEIIGMLFPKEHHIPLETSVLSQITSAFPPMYLMDSAYKSFSREAQRSSKVLASYQIPYQLHIFDQEEKLRHNFQILSRYKQSDIVLHELFAFFHRYL